MASSNQNFYFPPSLGEAEKTPSDQTSPDKDNNVNQQPTSILAGLNAFDGDESTGADAESTASANFADQLALWTNANFSFDGPTGHALLLDEDKDDDQNQPSGSGGNQNGQQNGVVQGNGGGNNGNGDVAGHDGVPAEPTHRDHKQQADQHQQSQYFAPPSSAAGEGRRPGRSTGFRDELARRNAENSTPNGTSGNAGGSGNGSGDSSLPFSVGQNAFSAFSASDDGRQQQQQAAQPQLQSQPHQQAHQQQQQQQSASFNALGNFGGVPSMSPDLLQALAFQQLLSGGQNPFAQGMMGMSGFNPAFGGAGGFGGMGMLGQFMPNAIDAPQQQQQQQQQQHRSSWQSQRGTSNTPSDDELEDDSAKHTKASGSTSSKASGKKRRVSSASGSKSEKAKAAAEAAAIAAEEAEIGRAAREEIPPLQLIDTGNPEADAEANRLAIEEDKRRRNTAASARFRIKKKAREQALEQTTKELEGRVRELEEQNSALTTENGWLKSLITIRPGGNGVATNANALGGGGLAGAVGFVSPQMAAAAGMMPPHFKDAQQQQQMMMFANAQNGGARNTGLRPRGVGTAEAGGSGSSSQRSQNGKGKRGRDE